ncbi:MAG: uroporphyrinogen-III C-methyltransferase [Pseudomonadales bacterium]|mgnify:CR=1 FL=1|nr:uroporphyrinogen-III C-methyltransferase [Pseudomonadales bacterium]MDP6469871.1 uroporphyrinogen-III C-methyltransferase [Pseudomonadales bacterium]MDP6827526.1 uroporphyrinogen-III C-methyltransferase [Pseudomonadales bacterium]MDP6971341.1 uroporphyrinogen-III C-methyltransferase [Pseudomonadales bacterium]
MEEKPDVKPDPNKVEETTNNPMQEAVLEPEERDIDEVVVGQPESEEGALTNEVEHEARESSIGRESGAGEPASADVAAETPAPFEASEPAGVTVAGSPSAKTAGRGLSLLALLVALAGAAGVGYLYWQLVYQNPGANVRAEIQQLSADSDRLATELASLSSGIDETLAAIDERQEARLRETEAALVASLGELANQAPPSEREWKLAEVEYLLRIANHRLLMERDFDTARTLLGASDRILAELDDFSLHEVRAALADELQMLSIVEGGDLQGLYLRLDALKRELRALAIAAPEFGLGDVDPSGEEDVSFWHALGQEFRTLLQFRRVETMVRPLMVPEESVYLELNLRLALEQAQLAALRRNQVAFEQSLDTALEWIESYLDTDDERVVATALAIDGLRGQQLEIDLPDISGSLNELLRVRRGQQ